MISKQKLKLIHSLEQKKNRDSEGLFIAEGPKVVGELAPHYACRYLAATTDWIEVNQSIAEGAKEVVKVTHQELKKASLLKTPQNVLAIFEKGDISEPSLDLATKELCLALDFVQDPGNFGTIIRIANWFGIRNIICSTSTADAFSPKVVQATMGALAGVNVYHTNLYNYLKNQPPGLPIYGTFLKGDNIYETKLTDNGIVIMGNEGNGICDEIATLVTNKLYIPPYPASAGTVESLNVGVATAITCAEFRRRTSTK